MSRVFRINNRRDLRLAYGILATLKSLDKKNMNAEYVKQLKLDIREYQKLPKDGPEFVHSDSYGYTTIRIPVPEFLKSEEEIEDWFECEHRMICRPSQYDCTGQLFTISHKVVKLHGQTYLYHHIGMDI